MSDDLEEIDGIKPKVWLPEGEEREVSSQSSNSTYKVKRTFDHYYCTCPAWRNQGGAPVNARTCKHLKALLGDKYEAARIKMRNPDGASATTAKSKAPAKKAKAEPKSKAAPKRAAAGKRKRASEEDGEADGDEEDDEEQEEKPPPAKRGRKPASSSKPVSKGKPKSKGKAKAEEEEEEEQDDEDEEEDEDDEEEGDEDVPVAKGKCVPDLLLANKWEIEKGPDPAGWWISEKLDGVRTFYDGKQFISRLGNAFTPPNWFLEKLPSDVTLDGELYGGRGSFQSTVSIVKTVNSVHWKNISFQIFDVPSRGTYTFEERYDFLQKTFGQNGTHASEQIEVVHHEVARDRQHVLDRLKEIESLGGEGVMLRKPGSVYEGKRSGSLLKIKTFYDAEAIVIGHAPGKGRNKGLTGALKCKMASGKLFNVGSGLTDKIRRDPPKVGSIIVYRFQELTRDGVPRFPSYVGEAVDKDKPKDAEIPPHRRTGNDG